MSRQNIATSNTTRSAPANSITRRGDDVLQLGRIDLAGARRYLQREVPAGSLPALLAASAVLALQRLVLPVMHWMDDTRAFGTLRPRRRSGR